MGVCAEGVKRRRDLSVPPVAARVWFFVWFVWGFWLLLLVTRTA